MILKVIAQTPQTITLGWDPVTGAIGYRGTRKGYLKTDGSQRWTQAGPEATQMKFSKDEWYVIEALRTADTGRYPPVAADRFPSQSLYPSET